MSDLNDLRLGLSSRVTAAGRKAQRISGGPALIRIVAALAALIGLLVALPVSMSTRPAVAGVCALLAAVVGVAPRSRWVTLILLGAAIAWLLTTLRYDEEQSAWRLGLLMAALYTAHTGAALAAVVPYDTVLSPGVLVRWLVRTGMVIGASLILGLVALLVLGRDSNVSTVVAPVAGIAVVAVLAVVLAWLLRRRG